MRLYGRKISGGTAEGDVIIEPGAVSFLGGVDPEEGVVVDSANQVSGQRIAGKVFAFSTGKGSTVGSYVIYRMKKSGTAPAAIINESAETIVASGAIISGIPMIDSIDISLLRNCDTVLVNADEGYVEMPGVVMKEAITVMIKRKDRVLILKRSERVGSCKGRWAGVSGHIESADSNIEDRVKKEVEEETKLDVRVIGKGEPILARDRSVIWKIHPFLAELKGDEEPDIDWEHSKYRWIRPEEVYDFNTVPKLDAVLRNLGLL